MASSSTRELTVAVTGLAAADNPAPGVAVARCLREAGGRRPRIIGLTFDHRFTGAYAADLFDDVFLVPPPALGERSFVEAVLSVRRTRPIDVLLPALDPDVALCASARGRLASNGIRTLVPTPAAIRRRGKQTLGPLAAAFGFSSPRTVTIASRTALTAALRSLGLPFFLKGSFADAVLVESEADAEAEFERMVSQWGLPLLAQERVAGDELNLAVLFDRRSAPVGSVAMRKLGITARGKGWAGVTLHAPDVVERSTALLRSIHWVGPAELELMRDPTTRRLLLLEINPRFPAWIYLTAAAGQNLPWVSVRLALGERVRRLPSAGAGVLFSRSSRDYFGPLEQVAEFRDTRHLVPRTAL